MNLYEAIFNRKSVRNYQNGTLPESLLNQIKAFCQKAVPLNPHTETKIELFDNTQRNVKKKGLWKVDAPYYLVLYSEEKSGYLYNAGYLMEQIVLYLTTKGLGSCYMGGARLLVAGAGDLKQVMVLAFGYPKGSLFRDPSRAKRLSLMEMCVFKEEADETVKAVLKAARLAPSSMNSQPWRFIVYKDRLHLFVCKEYVPSKTLASLREFNIGIVLSHIMLAAEEQWLSMTLKKEEVLQKKVYKNGEYAATILLQ